MSDNKKIFLLYENSRFKRLTIVQKFVLERGEEMFTFDTIEGNDQKVIWTEPEERDGDTWTANIPLGFFLKKAKELGGEIHYDDYIEDDGIHFTDDEVNYNKLFDWFKNGKAVKDLAKARSQKDNPDDAHLYDL